MRRRTPAHSEISGPADEAAEPVRAAGSWGRAPGPLGNRRPCDRCDLWAPALRRGARLPLGPGTWPTNPPKRVLRAKPDPTAPTAPTKTPAIPTKSRAIPTFGRGHLPKVLGQKPKVGDTNQRFWGTNQRKGGTYQRLWGPTKGFGAQTKGRGAPTKGFGAQTKGRGAPTKGFGEPHSGVRGRGRRSSCSEGPKAHPQHYQR